MRVLSRVVRRLSAPIYGGAGAIFCFHRIITGGEVPCHLEPACEIGVASFERLIHRLRYYGYRFISLDQARAELLDGSPADSPFAVFTFDDGYRSTYEVAWPICVRERVPFAVYVTPHLTDGVVPVWWSLAARWVRAHTAVSLMDGPRRLTLATTRPADKVHAYRVLGDVFRGLPVAEQFELAVRSFGAEAVRREHERVIATWEQLEVMAKAELVTIGAHSCSHPVLKTLSERQARWEITTCRDLLEARLRTRIRHFSFPFGSRREVGAREFRLAREAGYATATTTRLGNVFEEHRHHLHALPRLYHSSFSALATTGLVTGLLPARRSRGKRVVTA